MIFVGRVVVVHFGASMFALLCLLGDGDALCYSVACKIYIQNRYFLCRSLYCILTHCVFYRMRLSRKKCINLQVITHLCITSRVLCVHFESKLTQKIRADGNVPSCLLYNDTSNHPLIPCPFIRTKSTCHNANADFFLIFAIPSARLPRYIFGKSNGKKAHRVWTKIIIKTECYTVQNNNFQENICALSSCRAHKLTKRAHARSFANTKIYIQSHFQLPLNMGTSFGYKCVGSDVRWAHKDARAMWQYEPYTDSNRANSTMVTHTHTYTQTHEWWRMRGVERKKVPAKQWCEPSTALPWKSNNAC